MFINDPHTFQLVDTNGNSHPVKDRLHLISSAIEFMDLVLRTDDLCFKTVTLRNGHTVQRTTRLAKHLSLLSRYAKLFDPRLSFNPALLLFFDEYRKHAIQDFDGFGPHPISGLLVQACDVFNDFILQLRSRATNINLRKAIADWKSKFKSNKKRALALERELFELFSRLVVIRLDLGYLKATFKPEEILEYHRHAEMELIDLQDATYWSGNDISTPLPMTGRVDFETLQQDRKRLFANMKGKPSLFKDLVGYVSRIECTPLAGYHLHLVLYFDSSKVDKHEWRAQEIGLYWNSQITKGRGRFENCNLSWNKDHPYCGIGVIHRDDGFKRANLQERVLPYLCKDEQHVEVLPYKGCNLFSANLCGAAKTKRALRARRAGAAAAKPVRSAKRMRIQNRHFIPATST